MVMQITKSTGNKKPLGSLTAEAVQPEGAVLPSILVKSSQLSNLAGSKQSNHLQYYKNANLFHYMLIFYLKKTQYIEHLINKYLILQLPKSAEIAEG